MARNNYLTLEALRCKDNELKCILFPVTTSAKLPAKANPGESIFVSDMLANDATMGVQLMWNPVTQSWKKLY